MNCRACGYEEPYYTDYGRGGEEIECGGTLGYFKKIDNNHEYCPSCRTIRYIEKSRR